MAAMKSWLFLGNPKLYRIVEDILHFYKIDRPTTWLVNQHKDEIAAGDEVFFWRTGNDAALVGWGTIVCDPTELSQDLDQDVFAIDRKKFEGTQLRVRIKVDGVCRKPRSELLKNPKLAKLIAHAQGTNLTVPPDIAVELQQLIRHAG